MINPKQHLHNINAHIKFAENPLKFILKLLSWKKNTDALKADNCQKLTKYAY